MAGLPVIRPPRWSISRPLAITEKLTSVCTIPNCGCGLLSVLFLIPACYLQSLKLSLLEPLARSPTTPPRPKITALVQILSLLICNVPPLCSPQSHSPHAPSTLLVINSVPIKQPKYRFENANQNPFLSYFLEAFVCFVFGDVEIELRSLRKLARHSTPGTCPLPA